MKEPRGQEPLSKEPLGARRARRLSDEEIELWIAVVKGVARRRGASAPLPRKTRPAPGAAAPAEGKPSRAAPAPGKPAAPPLAPLEQRLRRSLARGRTAVDRSIDLHGMTQAQAHEALRRFLGGAQARGDRLVVVVTGTGAGRAAGASSALTDSPGVLRRIVPHWLQAREMRGIVLGFEEAARAHGGAGALYVRLRRSGK
jgi:DNA-nicking Smr family endonuclease